MHEYDTVLKALLQSSQNSIFERIIGVKFGRWLNVELPEVRRTRVDLPFETLDLIRRLIGRQEGEFAIPRRLIQKRFGTLSAWADDRLTTLSVGDLEDLSLRLLDAKSVNELFDR